MSEKCNNQTFGIRSEAAAALRSATAAPSSLIGARPSRKREVTSRLLPEIDHYKYYL